MDYINCNRPSEVTVRGIALQLASVLKYLKACNVLHRDLKPENILLTASFLDKEKRIPEIKVCDFGLSCILGNGETSSQCFGTMHYAAP